MQLNVATVAIAALAFLSVPSFAVVTPAQILSDIQTLTAKTQALQAPANSINILSGPLFLIGQGPFPQIIIGLADITTTANGYVPDIEGTPAITDDNVAQNIANAFSTFVTVQQTLLNTLIGKAGILNDLPLIGPPVASVLSQLSPAVADFGFAIIGVAQSQGVNIAEQVNSLDETIQTAISSYNGAAVKKRGVTFKA